MLPSTINTSCVKCKNPKHILAKLVCIQRASSKMKENSIQICEFTLARPQNFLPQDFTTLHRVHHNHQNHMQSYCSFMFKWQKSKKRASPPNKKKLCNNERKFHSAFWIHFKALKCSLNPTRFHNFSDILQRCCSNVKLKFWKHKFLCSLQFVWSFVSNSTLLTCYNSSSVWPFKISF